MINVGEGVLTTAVYGSATGLSMGGVFLFVRWAANFIAGRQDKKEAQIDGATERLIAGLESRLTEESESRRKVAAEMREEMAFLRAELAECNRRHAEAEAELKGLKAILQAKGEIKQQAQMVRAADKLAEKLDAERKAKPAKPKG